MSKLSCLQEKLVGAASFLEKHRAFINAHMVDFITKDHWRRLLPPQIQQELLRFQATVDVNLHLDTIKNLQQGKEFPCLQAFLKEAEAHTLRGLGICTALDEITESSFSDPSYSTAVFPSHLNQWLMSPKKGHEVELMGNFVASLCRKHDISLVVDCGSGKGYLSFCLAAKHRLNVLGIDAQATNTCGAAVRKEKMMYSLRKSLSRQDDAREEDVKGDERHQGNHSTDRRIVFDYSNKSPRPSCNNGPQLHSDIDEESVSTASSCSEQGVFIPLTSTVTEDTDLQSLVHEFEATSRGEECTTCVSNNATSSAQERPLLICGLHTCGPLSPNMIQLFLTRQQVKVLCHVGCCYHHLQEKFGCGNDPEEFDSVESANGTDFPLSSVLSERLYRLGRNARMLSAQPLERISRNKTRCPKSLFYRSLLEALLASRLGHDKNVKLLVGRTGLKCESFVEYVRKIEKKFPSLNLQVSDTFLSGFATRYQEAERELYAFQRLRSILAPCIEATVLLDRLVYLLEQESVREAHLVRLFDPVTSPRCYALLAVKKGVK